MSTFLTSLLSECIVQHSSDAIVIECDRATMPALSLRKQTRPSSTRSLCYGRNVLSSAINVRSQILDHNINKTQVPKLPVIYHDKDPGSRIVPSRSFLFPWFTYQQNGVRQETSPYSVLPCMYHLPMISPRSARWCRSRPTLVRCGSAEARLPSSCAPRSTCVMAVLILPWRAPSAVNL